MRHPVLVQNIEELRRREGIDDVELRREIHAIKIGDTVRLTLLTEQRPISSETVLVRITQINGNSFQGALVTRPTIKGLCTLPADLSLDFNRAHIHSLHRTNGHE